MLTVPRPVLDRVGAVIRACGHGATECVVYVTAPTRRPTTANDLIHPRHTATASSTHVGEEELDRIWDLLLEHGSTIVLQVHSHPGEAYHSHTDDCWPIIHRPGFPSLVVPRFGASGLAGAHLTTYQGDGHWQPSPWRLDHGSLLIQGGAP